MLGCLSLCVCVCISVCVCVCLGKGWGNDIKSLFYGNDYLYTCDKVESFEDNFFELETVLEMVLLNDFKVAFLFCCVSTEFKTVSL